MVEVVKPIIMANAVTKVCKEAIFDLLSLLLKHCISKVRVQLLC